MKLNEIKQNQGFTKDYPRCGNCKHFTFITELKTNKWTKRIYHKESYLRCSIGNFKVGKSNWCTKHEFKS